MPDLQFTPLPPDAQFDPQPPGPPLGAPPPQLTPLPPNAQLDAPPQPYQGRILPFSTNAQGNTYFDPNAGILGAALDAYRLPGDVLTGKQPMPTSAAGILADPDLMNRTANLASFFPSTSAATAAIPSAMRPGGPSGGMPTSFVPGARVIKAEATGPQLKAATDAAYDAARANPTVVPAYSVAPGAQAIQQKLQADHGLVPRTAPKTFDALDDLANPQSPLIDYTTLEASRQQLSEIAKSGPTGNRDPFAARQAITHLDSVIDANFPEAAVARANAAASARANMITGDLTQANTGILERADTAAQLRARVRTLTQNEDAMRGFNPEERQALTDFSKGGGVLSSALDKASRVIGSGAVSAGVGAYLGHELLGPAGAEIGAMTMPAVGGYFKDWATQRASNRLDAIAQQIRSRSPFGTQLQGQLTPNPSFAGQLPYRAVPPSLLATPPPQQPPPPVAPVAPRGPYPPLPTTGPIPAGLLTPWA